ncbi:LOW QUALITY PROTEIN: hypothetical protein Q4I28_001533 [Leishmania naiffi]|uniref:Integral membrane protein n=1 Tax=Leishmania naiffi TaxID=5678 RepID=A0AAW3C5S0_9TRYP
MVLTKAWLSRPLPRFPSLATSIRVLALHHHQLIRVLEPTSRGGKGSSVKPRDAHLQQQQRRQLIGLSPPPPRRKGEEKRKAAIACDTLTIAPPSPTSSPPLFRVRLPNYKLADTRQAYTYTLFSVCFVFSVFRAWPLLILLLACVYTLISAMSISSSVTYALLCVYYACRTVLLFMVETVLFLPTYYLVERHDTPSAWLGRRGEAQVQPVLSTAYQYQKAEERDASIYSNTADIVTVGAHATPLESSTREMEDSRCILSRKAVSRIRSLHTANECTSWWCPQVPRTANPSSVTYPTGTPQQRPQQRRWPLLPRLYSHPPPGIPQSRYDGGGGDDDMNDSGGSCSSYTLANTPLAATLQRPLSVTTTETPGWHDCSSGGEMVPISLLSSPMQRSQFPRGKRHYSSGLDEEDTAYASFNGRLGSPARDVVDGEYQQPYVTNAFFDGLVVKVLASAQQQEQQHLSAALRKRVDNTEADLSARWGHRQPEAASRRAAARTASTSISAATTRERLCATVPGWCTVVFHSPTQRSATRESLVEKTSSTFRGQYGFLPPWYAVHARAQLLLALADPLLRIAAELLCCRGWGMRTLSSVAPSERISELSSLTTWWDAGAFLLGPLLLCFRALRCLFCATVSRLDAAVSPHYSTRRSASPTSLNPAAGGSGVHPFFRLEGAVQTRIDRYITDTHRTFEPLHTHAAATTTVPSMPVTTHAGNSITPADHGLSQTTTASTKAVGATQTPAQGAALPPPLSSTSTSDPVCRQSVGVYWLHGRRPPIWTAASAGDLSTMSTPQPPSPAPVVVLLLCPSLLQGNGLCQHTVTRLSHLCQLLTLAGMWQDSFATDDAAAPNGEAEVDRAGLPTLRDTAITKMTQAHDESTDSADALQSSAPGTEKKPGNLVFSTNNSSYSGSSDSSEAEVNHQPSPQVTLSSPPLATRPVTRPAAQWYAAVPVVELRVSATSPERADDVSMPPLTLKDLRHIVERLRDNLESCLPQPTKYSKTPASTKAGRATRCDSFGQSPAEGAAPKVQTTTHNPRRAVYIVAVGWSEAASPLLELAITQQQQQQSSTNSGGSTEDENEDSCGAQTPARLDGVVCISHTLSSAFQLLPQQHAEAMALKQHSQTRPLPARAAWRASHQSASTVGSSSTLSAIAAPASSASSVTARLHAAPHMPRILSSLTTGPARLLVMLTRMHLIADALLAYRQHQEQWNGGGVAVVGNVAIPGTVGARHCAEAHAPTQPHYKGDRHAGPPPSQAGPASAPALSLYRILHIFREVREEVNRAQRGLDRATIVWTHQQQHLQARLAQRSAGLARNPFPSTGNFSALTSRIMDNDIDSRVTRAASEGQHPLLMHRQPPPLPPSSTSVGASSLSAPTATPQPQHTLSPTPFSKFGRTTSPLVSLASIALTASSSDVAAGTASEGSTARGGIRYDAVGNANVLTPPAFSSTGGGGSVPSLLSVDQDTPQTHDERHSFSRHHHFSHTLPLTMRHDFSQEPSVLWGLPRLETVTDWEELAKSPIMAEVQQQQRLEAANTTANDLPPPPSVDPPTLLSCGVMRVTPTSVAAAIGSGAGGGGRRRFLSKSEVGREAERPAASGSLVAPSSFSDNPLRCVCSYMSTEDVIASCTLQVVSPTARQAARVPVSAAAGAAPTAAADEERNVLVGVPSMGPSMSHTAVRNHHDSADRERAAPSLAQGKAVIEESYNVDATLPPSADTLAAQSTTAKAPSPSVRIATPHDGNTSSLGMGETEGKRGNTTSSSAGLSSREGVLHAPARSARSLVSHYGPPCNSPPPPPQKQQQQQQPIPYRPPSRALALSSQAAALVELRVRSAQHAALIQRIRVPTLLVHARDDPVAPTSSLPFSLLQANPWITTVLTRRGSHAVFMEGASDVWRRPRLVVTERLRPADTTLPASATGMMGDMVYWPSGGPINVGRVPGPRGAPSWDPLSASAASQWGDASLPSAAARSPQPPAPMPAARLQGPPPFPEDAKTKHLRGSGTSSSSTSISNSCSTDDFCDDDDTGIGALVEWLPVKDVNAGVQQQQSNRRQCTALPSRSHQQQRVAAAAVSQWQVRIEGTTWLERCICEYVEKVILCPPAPPPPPSPDQLTRAHDGCSRPCCGSESAGVGG